jgi:hypothetical protein
MLRPMLAAAALAASAFPASAGTYSCGADCYRQAHVPARYGSVVEPSLVRAPRTYAVVTPPKYRTVYETVPVRPAGRVWTVRRDAHGRKVGCWIEVPARYATVPRRVMVSGAEIVPYAQTAVWGYQTSPVLLEPAHKTWVPISAHGFD